MYGNYATYTLSDQYAGGIVGYASSSSKIRACYFAGTLSSGTRGGIIGRAFNNSSEIQACYAAGNATSLYGSRNSAVITNSDYDSGAADAGSFGKATTLLKSPTGYTGIFSTWNIDKDGNTGSDPWDLGTESPYPG